MQLEEGDVTALPFDDASFGRVLSSNTVYFWPDPVAALQEIRRVLVPGGRLVLMCENKESLERYPTSRHGFTVYDADEVRALLERAGCRPRPRGDGRPPMAITARSAGHRR